MYPFEALEKRAKEEGITVDELCERIDRKVNPWKYKPIKLEHDALGRPIFKERLRCWM